MRRDSPGDESSAGVTECVSQLFPDVALDPHNLVRHSDHNHVDDSASSHRQSSEVLQVAQDCQQDPAAESNTEQGHLGHPVNTRESQNERGRTWRTSNSTSEAHSWNHENRHIVDKVLTTKFLIAQFEKVNGEIPMLEAQQTLAQSRFSDLDSQVRDVEITRAGLLAEAQTWRERATEAERKALSHQRDAESLKELIEKQKESSRTAKIASRALEESARLAERVQHAMEETFGGDLVNLLSLCKRDVS